MKKHVNHCIVLLISIAGLFLLCFAVPVFAISLDQIIALAEKQDPQLRADIFSAEALNADGWRAVAEYGPTLSVSGRYAKSRDSSRPDQDAELENRVANFTEGEVTVGMEQPLVDMEKASIAMRGMAERKMSILQIKKAYEKLFLRVHNRYYAVLSAQENLRLARNESVSLRQQLDRAKEKLTLGFGTITDQQNAEARYSLSLAAEISSKTELDNSLKALEEIIDQELVEEIEDLDPDMILPQISGDKNYWLDIAELNNTDLGVKRLQVETAHLSYRAAQSRFLPALVLYGDYNERHPDDSLLEYGEERTEFDVGVRLEVNLLSGGKDSAATVAASRREKAAKEEVIAAKRSVYRSVRSLWDSIYTTKQLVEAYRQAANANQRAMESTQASYDEGVKVLLDVLNAQQDYFRSLREYKTTRYEYMVLLEKFRQVVGVEVMVKKSGA